MATPFNQLPPIEQKRNLCIFGILIGAIVIFIAPARFGLSGLGGLICLAGIVGALYFRVPGPILPVKS